MTPRLRPYVLLAAFGLATVTLSAWATIALLGLEKDAAHPGRRAVFLALAALVVPTAAASLFAPTVARSVAPRRGLVGGRALALVVVALGLGALIAAPEREAGIVILVGLGILGIVAAFESAFADATVRASVPDTHLARERGVLATTAFGGVAVGMAAAVATLQIGRPVHTAALVVSTALAALVAAAASRPTSAAASEVPPTPGPLDVLRSSVHALVRDPGLFRAGVAALVTAFVSGLFLAAATARVAAVTDSALVAVGVVIAFAAGAAAAAAFAGAISGRTSEPGLAPLGFLVLFPPLFATGILRPLQPGFVLAAAIVGIAAGLLVVPIETLFQRRAHAMVRSVARAATLAVGGLGAGLATGLLDLGADLRDVLFGAGIVALVAFVIARELLPAAFTRMVFVAVGRLVFAIRVKGLSSVPREGPALIVCNHVSFVDWWILGVAAHRPVRFVIDRSFYEKRLFHGMLKQQQAIPVAADGTSAELLRSLREAGRALDEGHLVCIFAEGQITRLGTLLPLQRGIDAIVRKRSVPVVPAYLDGLWGHATSFARGPAPKIRGGLFRRPLTVVFGEPDAAAVDAAALQPRLEELERRAWGARLGEREPLHRPLLRAMAPFSRRLFPGDPRPASLFELVVEAAALAATWRTALVRGDRVASACADGRAAAVVTLAAGLSGRRLTTIDAGRLAQEGAAALRGLGIDQVLTDARARAVLGPKVSGFESVDVEAQLAGMPRRRRLAAALALTALPPRALEVWCGSGTPPGPADVHLAPRAGVALTHGNVAAAVEACARVFRVDRDDRVLCALPAADPLAVTVFWWAARLGHALDWRAAGDAADVAELCARRGITVMIVGSDALGTLIERASPRALGSVRKVLAIGPHAGEDVLDAFEERFGLRPLSGRGLPDGTPLAFVEVEDGRARGILQRGRRPGSLGRPLPAVRVEVLGADGAPVAAGAVGRLEVRSPLRPGATEAALADDAAGPPPPLEGRRDPDGFVFVP